MPRPLPRSPQAQTGAITIMVALMLLVLLTLAAVGMSRNSFREVVNSAFVRQGSMTSSVADSGLEWALYWITEGNSDQAASDGTGAATKLVATMKTLAATPSLQGQAWDISTTSPATTVYASGGSLPSGQTAPTAADPTGVTQGFTLGMTYMGTVNVAMNSNQQAAVNLFSIRSDAQVQQNSVTFTHAKEAWFTSPIQ
jgi:Tfp pilus assembly protein PilX